MINLAQKLEDTLCEVYNEQQVKANEALQSLKEVNEFLWNINGCDTFDLKEIENEIEGMCPSDFMNEIEAISKIFPTKEETA
jgi:hypothetical protein